MATKWMRNLKWVFFDKNVMLNQTKTKSNKKTKEIVPVNEPGDSRSGTLTNLTAEEISEILGFAPNVKDDPYKVQNSWGFSVDGKRCGIWDYKGSHHSNSFSTFGPHEVLCSLFGEHYSSP